MVEGQDVAGLLTQALERFKVPLEVKAVVNDTVRQQQASAVSRALPALVREDCDVDGKSHSVMRVNNGHGGAQAPPRGRVHL